jgi:hypothetical protein
MIIFVIIRVMEIPYISLTSEEDTFLWAVMGRSVSRNGDWNNSSTGSGVTHQIPCSGITDSRNRQLMRTV